MNTSATSPRAALMARARQHFAAIAATSVVLTGGLTALAATTGHAAQSTPGETTTGTTSDSTSGATTQTTPESSPHSSFGSGLVSGTPESSPDASSNAS